MILYIVSVIFTDSEKSLQKSRFFSPYFLVGIEIHIVRTELGVDVLLFVVQAVVAGQHIADGAADGEEHDTVCTKKLDTQEQ